MNKADALRDLFVLRNGRSGEPGVGMDRGNKMMNSKDE